MTTPLPPGLLAGLDQARAELAELVKAARAHRAECPEALSGFCPGDLPLEVPGRRLRLLFALAVHDLAAQPEAPTTTERTSQ